jgi:Mn2+/Fe2+ NRAMP family transporter
VVTGALALLGTTLTSYVYVWETVARGFEDPSEEVPRAERLPRARVGAAIGAIMTAFILWFMLVASAATLGRHHDHITSAQDAAQMLRPLTGSLASDFFAFGLVGSSLVALPVLMATTAHVFGAQFSRRRGLSQRVSHARGFYGLLTASIGLAFAVTAAKISVIGMLLAASVFGGFCTPIGLVILVLIARDNDVMRGHRISRRLAAAGWTVAVVVTGFGVLSAISIGHGNFWTSG